MYSISFIGDEGEMWVRSRSRWCLLSAKIRNEVEGSLPNLV